jgi:uncharacterized protein (TIGR02600 family)
MKLRLPFHFRNRARYRGMALLLVLAAVAFVSILTLAFLVSVNHELVSSKSYASGASSRIYADAAVNLVIGQLQAGTTQNTSSKTWVSQPGLIRLFDNTGAMVNAYKLYSSSKMVESGTFAPMTASGDPSDVPAWNSAMPASSLPWEQSPNVYVDLNSPITVNSVTKYPILNPGGLAAATQIEGFSVSANYTLANQIPMPVTWIYILTDGRLATPQATPSDSTAVTLTTPDGNPVAANNPPVARVAFWTDDDTCRLNINTASEGNFWTMAFDEVGGDTSLSRGQINSNEYQRYPGHPATTCLSPVFDFLTNSASSSTDLRNFIFALTPRVSGRGSQFGARVIGYGKTVNPDSDRLYASVDELLFLPKINTATGTRYPTTTANIQAIDTALPDAQRHLDWNFTDPNVPKDTTGTAYAFASNFSLDAPHLELARFFLTANSRAPEINLFGQPRLSLWPIDTRTDHQSVWDQSLAFASTIGGYPYYFQRQNPNSQTEDYTSIPRNQLLLPYLDHLTSSTIPGYGGNFSTKYSSADREQVLTSMFDWIRTVNLAYPDMTGAVKPYDWTTNSTATLGASIPPALPGSGQVLPIQINSTQGYGRFPTLSKAAIGIIRENEQADTPAAGQTTVQYRVVFLMETYVPMVGYAGYMPNYHIQVSGLANGFNLVTQTPATKASPITQAINFQDGDIHVTAPSNFEAFTGRAWGGTQGFNNLFAYSDSSHNYQLTARTLGGSDMDKDYPFVSGLLSVTYPTSDKSLIQVGINTSATVTVKFYDAADAQSIATYTAPFASFGPLNGAYLATTGASTATVNGGCGTGSSDTPNDLQSRVNQMVTAGGIYTDNPGGTPLEDWAEFKNVIGTSDVVRGVELNHGDFRISAILGTDSNSKFVPHKDYANTNYPQAHSLLGANGSCYAFDTARTNGATAGGISIRRGVLVSGTGNTFSPASTKSIGTPGTFVPQAPSAMSAATNAPGFTGNPGDFSTGLGSEGDGPHIMKADEGNSSFVGMNWGASEPYPYQNQFFPFDSKLASAFSPNRQVSSAVQFGTLPSQPKTPVPWQTLLFRPDFTGTHPGAKSPADSLLLDLFWMPVTDPYPVSEQFSTAGKVNMNYQIVPFTYITRSTAMIGALRATKVGAISVGQVDNYKHTAWVAAKDGNGFTVSDLYAVDPVKTLMFFTERFSNADPNNNIFKSPSEICSIPLAPAQNANSLIDTKFPLPNYNPPSNPTATVDIYDAADANALRTQIKTFWADNTLTGDNVLEAPYNALYPRLTTQSNTYTVYTRAQALQVTGPSTGGTFTHIQDRVVGEYRGSYEVERYLDINDASIPDFADPANYSKTIYPYYKFRILSNKQFIP